MVSLESLMNDLLKIVEHLVNTHSVWNGNMTQETATEIVNNTKQALAPETPVADDTPKN